MRERSEIPKIILGSFCVLVINAVIFCIGLFVASYTYGAYQNSYYSWLFPIAVFSIMGISITQLIYVIPVIIWLKRRQQIVLMKGVIVGAVITALLNGGCYLIPLLRR